MPFTRGAMFLDRTDAGRRLAEALQVYRDWHPIILAMPRGGVPVGAEVAKALEAPLDIVLVRKIGAPGHPEYAVGAIAPGVTLINEAAVRRLNVSQAELDQILAEESRELARREYAYRGDRPKPNLEGRLVIVVDDGLATGASASAAIQSIRHGKPAAIIFASPVCAPDSARDLKAKADAVICVASPSDFHAVSLWYEDFSPTTDQEVIDCLKRSSLPVARS